MSIGFASARGISSRDVPYTTTLVTSANPWVRPTDWPAITTVGPTEQKFVGLLAVFNSDSNYVALVGSTSVGTYTVDWGDGSSPQTYTNNTVASYRYTYSTIPSSPIASGYKTVEVTVTATTGNLTGINLQQKYTNSAVIVGTLNNIPLNWLDINFGSPFATGCIIGGGTYFLGMLQRCNVVSMSSSNPLIQFQNCSALEEVIISTSIPNSSCLNMFNGCYSLKYAPEMNTAPSTNFTNMFNSCWSLRRVPFYNLSNAASTNSMFYQCYALQTIPTFDTSKVTDMVAMFNGCNSLQFVPYLNTANVANFNLTFSTCSSLNSVPTFNTIKATNTSSMFFGCYNLKTIPTFNTSNVTTMQAMFQNCAKLTTIPTLNTSKLTATGAFNLFNGCTALVKLEQDTLDLSNCTQISTMFNACSALTVAPTMLTSNATTATQVFNGCSSLNTVPVFDTSKVTVMNQLFQNCRSLITIPALNTSNATNLSGLIQFGSPSVTTIPLFNTTKVTTVGSMLSQLYNLKSIPALNLGNCTTTTAFSSLPSLSSFNATNLKVSTTFASCAFSKEGLENIFANSIVGNAVSQTITITSNPGTDPVKTVSAATITINNIDASSTTGVEVGMYAYGNGINSTLTANFSSTTNEFQVSGFGSLEPGNGIMFGFTAFTVNPGLNLREIYYSVEARSGGFFKLSLTPGGTAITLTATSSGTITYANYVTSVGPNNVVLKLPGTSGSGLTVTFRKLNTHGARIKNWTVTG